MSEARPLERRLGSALVRWVTMAARHRRSVAIAATLLFLLALGHTATSLGIRSQIEALFPEDLPFRIRDARFLEVFPNLSKNIVVVIEGPGAESTRSGALRLAERLAAEPELFPRVYLPAHPFFEEHGLLYLELDELDAVADRLAQLQPLLAGMIADESLRGLLNQTRLALESLHSGRIEEVRIGPILGRIEETVRDTLVGGGAPLDWSEIVDWGEPAGDPLRRVIRVQPKLDYGSLAAAEEAIQAIFEIARETGLVPEAGFRLRLTGDMVLNFEEMKLLRTQVAWAGVGSFVVVACLLFAALRSWRLVLATVASLVFGLAVTAGFATLAIGHLNMISVAFAVLFIGLGVDFGIHLCMRFQELRAAGSSAEEALRESARGVGSSLMLCAGTTSVGFFAFVPTDFVGVAELGVIAGVGMFIGVSASFTIIPAIVIGDDRPEGSIATPRLRVPHWPADYARTVLVAAVLAALAAASLLPRLRFDQNPLNVRDPSADSVRVYQELLAERSGSPWTLDVLAADAGEAERLAEAFDALPEVEGARTLADYVPEDQAAKLAVIEEIALFSNWDAIERQPPPRELAASRDALDRLVLALEAAGPELSSPDLARAAASLSEALRGLQGRLEAQTEVEARATIGLVEARLLGNFRDLLRRIERALRARPVTQADLPRGLREAMVSASGIQRVEVQPAADLSVEGELDRFVEAGYRVSPELAGPATRIYESARSVVGALRQALGSSIVVITLLLFVLWRRVGHVLLVMAPLLWASLMTGASMVIAGIDFNFADVIVLPLLLGIGVDSGIHMVHRHRIRGVGDGPLLATSTARAIVFSAFTTIASFGTLAVVPHQGMANLGQLLAIGVGWTVVANLVVLPALLELRSR